jgi:Dyp-type peroxidase family
MAELEPLLDWDDIQGNILGGFNKNHQTLLGIGFGGDAARAKRIVAGLAAKVTTLREVMPFKRRHRARAAGLIPADTPLTATWTAVAFSFEGLKLLSADADQFSSAEFRAGLAASATRIGDQDDPATHWVVGQPGKVPDLFVIIAADKDDDRAAAVDAFLAAVAADGGTVVYNETGHDLSFYSTPARAYPCGHEHFGFKDGVSQPGVRGRLPDGSDLTDRTVPVGDDGIEFAAPGQPLVCAGEFVLGEATEIDYVPRDPGDPVPLGAAAGAVAPAWAANGSFLVFRRLLQDVGAFRAFAAAVGTQSGTTGDLAAARIVGRWPSGAPIMRTPNTDDGKQALADTINAFGFSDDNPAFGLPTDGDGAICPVAAHIRKVNPRDDPTDRGQASATLQRRLLRRGIPFGPPFDTGVEAERGLLFLSYQSSIADQFEFLCFQWMNNPTLPRNPGGQVEGEGHDLLVGQRADGKPRFAWLPSAAGPVRVDTTNAIPNRWVTASGGGYFFAPSMTALRTLVVPGGGELTGTGRQHRA